MEFSKATQTGKKTKRSSFKNVITRLDTLVSHIVRERDGECVICHTKRDLTCGHLFSRKSFATRWDLSNCHCQCLMCNGKHEIDRIPYQDWYISKFGQTSYDELEKRSHSIYKVREFELEELYIGLKKVFKTITENLGS